MRRSCMPYATLVFATECTTTVDDTDTRIHTHIGECSWFEYSKIVQIIGIGGMVCMWI